MFIIKTHSFGSRVRRLFFIVLCVMASSASAVDLRATHWEVTAQRHGLDPLLLYAVALQETQRPRGEGTASPWPWTLRSAEGPRFYERQAEADADLRGLLGRYRNIDVGLMQVNLRWHGHRVVEPGALLDARTNLAVAAEILAQAIRSAPGDPELGVGRYHHWNDERVARSYGRKVLALWAALRQPR
jgi:hypothetical protein